MNEVWNLDPIYKGFDDPAFEQDLNALKKIYNEGISNPYTPPAVTVQLSPVSGSEEANVDGDWIVNTYQFDASIDRDTWKFRILGDDIMSMVENGTIEVYAGNTKLMPQTNVSGAWDTAKAFKVDMGDDVYLSVNLAPIGSVKLNGDSSKQSSTE